ncbi:hypothetical protein T492DRAFT_986740, partial [Pavlovales sp. CCMP2436]
GRELFERKAVELFECKAVESYLNAKRSRSHAHTRSVASIAATGPTAGGSRAWRAGERERGAAGEGGARGEREFRDGRPLPSAPARLGSPRALMGSACVHPCQPLPLPSASAGVAGQSTCGGGRTRDSRRALEPRRTSPSPSSSSLSKFITSAPPK